MADEEYLKSLDGAEWFVILSRGFLGFRYGPYKPEDAGKIMVQCQEESIPCFLTAYCGTEFDWDVARDFARGVLADWRPMDEAPTDGTEFMAEVAEVETRVVWWINWEWWREALPNGEVGRPVDPIRWRPLTDEERGQSASQKAPHPDHDGTSNCWCPDCIGF